MRGYNLCVIVDTKAAWIAALAYTFQIYYDFSGYSDMAIGLGRCPLMRNAENFSSVFVRSMAWKLMWSRSMEVSAICRNRTIFSWNQQRRIAEKQALLDGLVMKIEDVYAVVEEAVDLAYEKACEMVTDCVKEETIGLRRGYAHRTAQRFAYGGKSAG